MTQPAQPTLPVTSHQNNSRNTLAVKDIIKVADALKKIKAEIKEGKHTYESLIKYVAETLQITVTKGNLATALDCIDLSLGDIKHARARRAGGTVYTDIKDLKERIANLEAAVVNLSQEARANTDALANLETHHRVLAGQAASTESLRGLRDDVAKLGRRIDSSQSPVALTERLNKLSNTLAEVLQRLANLEHDLGVMGPVRG